MSEVNYTSLEPSLATFCNPYVCDEVGHERLLTAKEIEDQVKRLVQSTRVGMIFMSIMKNQPFIRCLIRDYIESLPITFSTPHISLAAQRFREQFKLGIASLLNNPTFQQTVQAFGNYLIKLRTVRFRQGNCFTSGGISDFEHCHRMNHTPGMIISCFEQEEVGKALNGLRLQGWNDSEIARVKQHLYSETAPAFMEVLASSILWKWFTFLDNNMSYTLLLILKPILEAPCPESVLTFKSILHLWWDAEVDGAPRLYLKLETLKKQADDQAALKDYELALYFYGMLNFPALKSSFLLQSLTNAAALRLRISGEEPQHIQIAILECSMALEIDPNNVKALFRRGLGIAVVKKWNESIVDFERALELDPLSPAKKELEVARRQVMRRIGN